MNKLIAQTTGGIDFDPIKTPSVYDPPTNGGIGDYTSKLEALISNILVVLTVVAGLAFTIYFLLGALNWITAGGDKGKIETAKAMMTNGAVGLIIVAVSYSVVWIVGKAIGIEILAPSIYINNLLFR